MSEKCPNSKYNYIISNFHSNMTGKVIAFEVTAELGQISKSLNDLFTFFKIPKRRKDKCKLEMAFEAIKRSSSIFSARNLPYWSPEDSNKKKM